MKKNRWYYWLIYAGIWMVAGIANYFEGKGSYHLFQIIVFLALAPCQLICEKYGEKGAKAFRYICIGALLLSVAYLGAVIYSVLR